MDKVSIHNSKIIIVGGHSRNSGKARPSSRRPKPYYARDNKKPNSARDNKKTRNETTEPKDDDSATEEVTKLLADIAISDSDENKKMVATIAALKKQPKHVQSVFEAAIKCTPESVMSMVNASSRRDIFTLKECLNLEVRRRRYELLDKRKELASQLSQLSHPKSKRARPYPTTKCFKCDQRGHVSENCTSN